MLGKAIILVIGPHVYLVRINFILRFIQSLKNEITEINILY